MDKQEDAIAHPLDQETTNFSEAQEMI